MAAKLIRDAVHGDIEFTAAEMAVVDTPPVQRLRGIRQLGASNLVYPGAVHTRFEHSLGTAWLAKQLMAGLAARGQALDAGDARAVPIAALLHDVTHVPFGHTFEDERRLFPRHDEDATRLNHFLNEPNLAAALAASGVDGRVRELLGPRPANAAPDVARDLIDGTVCADLLDYLRRDAYYTGLPQTYDDRLFRSFSVCAGRLTVELQRGGLLRHDVLSELIHLLRVRYNLTERVYYHHAKSVAGGMISKALELALNAERIAPHELLTLGDESFLWLLRQRCHDLPGVIGLLDDLGSHRLYKRVFVTSVNWAGERGVDAARQAELARRYHDDAAARRAGEESLGAALGVAGDDVLIYCPSPRMQLKEATVQVNLGGAGPRSLADLRNPEVAALADKYRTLWRLMVCVRRSSLERVTGGPARADEAVENLVEAPNLLLPAGSDASTLSQPD